MEIDFKALGGPSSPYDPIRAHQLRRRPTKAAKNGKDGQIDPPLFTPQDFCAWMERHGLAIRDVMKLFRINSRTSVTKYRNHEVPHIVALACRCVDHDRKMKLKAPVFSAK